MTRHPSHVDCRFHLPQHEALFHLLERFLLSAGRHRTSRAVVSLIDALRASEQIGARAVRLAQLFAQMGRRL
jgi:hypothetical protein